MGLLTVVIVCDMLVAQSLKTEASMVHGLKINKVAIVWYIQTIKAVKHLANCRVSSD